MSVDRAGKLPPRNQPEMPAYFRKDRVGRDEFLSQLGHFGEEHRALFSRLCDMWEPDMAYSKFFAKAGHEFLNADATLHTLMVHLEKGNCGLIANIVKDGQLEKDQIILTDRDAPRFWYWYVENLWQTCRVSDRTKFPTVKSVVKRGGFSDDVLQPLSLAEISGTFIDDHFDDVILYALPDLDGKTLIVTPATLTSMVEVAKLKIRAHLANSPVQPILARLMGTVVSNIRTSLSKNDTQFWNNISDTIVVHREDLLAKKANLSAEIFIAAKILKIFTRNELDESEHRREQDAEKREAIQGILAQLAKKNQFLVPPSEFDAQFEPYKEKWPDLREMFIVTYLKPSGRTGLPAVVNISEDYIYRDHLYPLFKSQHQIAAAEMKDYYLNLAERILRTNNKDKITAYTGIKAFREDVREQLALEYPILSELLSKPRIVSEGIIHYNTKVLNVQDMDRVKNVLERFFEAGSIRFLHPDKLFELSPNDLFISAFQRLSWFRKIILKLFGRYDSYLHALNASGFPDGGKASGSAGHNPAEVLESVRVLPYRASLPPGESVTEAAVRRRKQSGAAKRRYSMNQQEQAWDEFKNAYEKKKGP